jgi:hypothetical protein
MIFELIEVRKSTQTRMRCPGSGHTQSDPNQAHTDILQALQQQTGVPSSSIRSLAHAGMGCKIRTALAGIVIMSLEGSCLLQCEAIFLSASMSAGTLSAGRLTGPVGSKTLVCILYEGCKGILHEGGAPEEPALHQGKLTKQCRPTKAAGAPEFYDREI